MKHDKKPGSELVKAMPAVCANEDLAVEFFERQLWGGKPVCAHCKSPRVYAMMDSKTGGRSQRYLWRCRECQKQFTVRVGTVLEESRIPLRHWAYAFWRASTSKKGVAAKELQRQCQISYPSALFLMQRIRYAMKPARNIKLKGIVEVDETYVGGKPRPGSGKNKRGRGTSKTPVFGMVERGGKIKRQVVADVSGKNLKAIIRAGVHSSAAIHSDEWPSYTGIGSEFAGGHHVVNHGRKEYVRGNVMTNTAESSFATLKRGIVGIYHSVSRKHLHRYISEFDFRWNARNIEDGERTALAVRGAKGKRLDYKTLVG